jgi:rhamnogalacturonan endolyase
MRRRGARLLVSVAAALAALPAMASPLAARAEAQEGTDGGESAPVQLQVSGLTAVMSNGIYTISFDRSGTAKSLLLRGRELIGPAKGFYSSVNGSQGFSPTSLQVVTDTPAMADIAYSSPWGDLHYVTRRGVSGLYSYFVATGIGTVGEFRTLYRVDGSIFRNGSNAERSGAFPTLADIQAGTKLQDETFLLQNGTVYTKYDWATYVAQDRVHGVYGGGAGVWLISASHEYFNGGPMKQELMVHVESATGDGVVLNMLAASHFGTPAVSIPSGKIFGPWLVYFNDGSIADAQRRAAREEAAWPYTWLSNPQYPLARTTVSGRIVLANGRPAQGAVVTLAQPGGDPYTQGGGYILSAWTDEDGRFTIQKVRPGTYSLYAFANGGRLGGVTDQFQRDGVSVGGRSTRLGTMTWSPRRSGRLLWQIGTADRTAAEFRLGSLPRQYGLFDQVPADLTYTIGDSTPARDWFYAQTKVGTWTVAFDLRRPPDGTAVLTMPVASASRNPTVEVAVNGTVVSTLAFGNDQTIYRSGNRSGFYQPESISFPAALLHAGPNAVTFHLAAVTRGGGIMYDTVKLEAAD